MSMLIAFLGTCIISFSQVIAWSNILGKKVNLKINWYKILLLCGFIFLNHHFVPNFIKGLLTLIIGLVFCIIITNVSLRKSIIITFITQLLIIVSESILVFICVALLKIKPETFETVTMNFVFDIFMFMFIVVMSNIIIFKKLNEWILQLTYNIKINQLVLLIFFVALGSNIFGATLYFKNNYIVSLCFNIFISLIYTIVIFFIFRYQNKYYKINSKYNMSLESLKMQEQIINDYRIINHENKNQLLTIREMTKSKKAINYIDTLVNKKSKHNNKIVNKIYKLPTGGIRGLIYNKLHYISDMNLKYSVNIDSKISSKSFSNLNNNDIVDICQILGVFIDNAIEETIDYKDKPININFYYDSENNVVISITNFYTQLKLNNINEFKSSKGKNRGYGLKLVKNIIKNNYKLRNNRIITKETFSQELVINQN